MRKRCSPLSVREPISGDELRARIAAALAWIAPANRLQLPASFDDYLGVLESTTWYGHHVDLDFILSSPRSIADRADGDSPERHDDHDVAREAGLWIAIGDVRDKHTYHLCCDRDRPLCGHVVDAHDDHPYLNGTQYLHDLGMFDEWLEDVAALRYHTKGGTLIVLSPEERVELDPVLASGDAWQLIVAARDLEYKLTPDEAWQHAKGAPARVLRFTKPPDWAELAIARDDETEVALVPRPALAKIQIPPYSLGAWDDRKFQFVEDARKRIAVLPPGDLLYVGPAA